MKVPTENDRYPDCSPPESPRAVSEDPIAPMGDGSSSGDVGPSQQMSLPRNPSSLEVTMEISSSGPGHRGVKRTYCPEEVSPSVQWQKFC